MKKVLIIGAGAQGGPCASIMAKDGSISEIRLGDFDISLAQAVQKKIGSSKVKAMQLDAGNLDAVTKAAEGVDAVINLTLSEFNDIIIKAAAKNNNHYVDTSSNETYRSQLLEGKRPLNLEEDFKTIGKTALFCCGASPGLTNVMVKYVCDQMEEVDKICIRLGFKFLDSENDIVQAWSPFWSPITALRGYADLPCVYEGGEYKTLPIFSRPEEYIFPDPVGKYLISSHSHSEPYSIPYYIKKGLKEVDFKYPVDPIAGALVKMGFASEEEVEVRGTKMFPYEILLKMLPPVANAFLAENEDTAQGGGDLAAIMEVKVDGVLKGRKVTYTVWIDTSLLDPSVTKYLYQTFGTTQVTIPLPAVVGAKMCMNGMTEAGIIFPECLNPDEFFRSMADMGAPIVLRERITCEKTFT